MVQPIVYDYDRLAYAEILQAVLVLAATWQSMNESNDNQEFWKKIDEIRESLRRIELQLHNIELKLIQIQKQIALLPERVRGIVDEALARDALALSQAINQRIRDYCQPHMLDNNLGNLKFELDKLHDQIWRIKGAKGITGLFLTSPILSCWLTASVVLAKASQRLNLPFESPWKSAFMLDSKKEFLRAFQEFDELSAYIRDFVIPHFPKYDARKWVIANEAMYYFEDPPTNILVPKNLIFRVHYQASSKTEILQTYGDFSKDWIEVDPSVDTPITRRALAAMAQFTTDRLETKEFSSSIAQLLDDRVKIMQFFEEPSNIWEV